MSNIKSILEINKLHVSYLFHIYLKNKGDSLFPSLSPFDLCDSGGIQTHNLLIRSQMLYSVELRNHSAPHYLICGCKGTYFF